jgi:hypothetical protein
VRLVPRSARCTRQAQTTAVACSPAHSGLPVMVNTTVWLRLAWNRLDPAKV